jgi:hypothetical protein
VAKWPGLPPLRRHRECGQLMGKSTRLGVHKCRDCRKPFTVKVGTIFESSHIRLNVWLQAIFLIASISRRASSRRRRN